ncbi:MAG: protein-glutamate O-methyltransferase CheR [Polyangiaceae bacterium]
MLPATFARIQTLVRDRSAIVLEPGKEYLVEARLSPIARAHGLANIDELCLRVERGHRQLEDDVVEAMTTNETSFFRDYYPFAALREQIIPEMRTLRGSQRRLDIWCAASSTGQEPYSIAMLLADHFPDLVATWNINILATDLSRAVLSKARAGRYRQPEVNRGTEAQHLINHFTRDGMDWVLKDHIRKMVRFEPLNLIGNWPMMGPFDLIFVRNVLIYFDADAKCKILDRAAGRLQRDGYLFLGGAETPPTNHTLFERLPLPRAGAYRLAQRRAGER